MGMDKSTYIGPFIVASGKIIKETTKVKRVCPTHKRETKDKYCSLCGLEIQSVDFIDKKEMTSRQFFYSSGLFRDDILYCPEYVSTFLPNTRPPKSTRIDENGGYIDLSDVSIIKEQMDWFKKKYAEEIQIFEDNFETSVKWGVVNYWS
jgi:hypothetical protein